MIAWNDPEISLALPCYNERDNIADVVEHSIGALDRLGRSWELIVIDNHSSDGTPTQVRTISDRDSRIRLIIHETNRFYSGSCRTALAEARGRYLVIMDSDGQFTADDLPRFLQALESGANLVFGWRKVRHDPLARRVMSWVFNRMGRHYLGCDLHDLNVGIRMFDRRFIRVAEIKHTLNMANPELYMRARRAGLTIAEVEATHFAREKGQSCHNLLRLYQIFARVRRYFRDLCGELLDPKGLLFRGDAVPQENAQVPESSRCSS
jgi:glycosyltransferase involved in cell wall biosynthesis